MFIGPEKETLDGTVGSGAVVSPGLQFDVLGQGGATVIVFTVGTGVWAFRFRIHRRCDGSPSLQGAELHAEPVQGWVQAFPRHRAHRQDIFRTDNKNICRTDTVRTSVPQDTQREYL